MGDGGEPESAGATADASPSNLPDAAVLERLRAYMRQSIMVVRRDWTVTADLGPPGGVLGHGPATGLHPFSFLHPDDVERVAGIAQTAMESEPGWSGSIEVRLQRADGDYGRFAVDLHNHLDDPVLQGVVVVGWEVPTVTRPAADTGRPVAVETLGEHLPIGVVLLDASGDVVFANQTACELLGCDLNALLRGELPPALPAVDREEVLAIIRRLRRHPGRESLTAAVLGEEQRLLAATFVSRAGTGTDGAVELVIVTVEDVTHRLARERHLEHRANHDSLTGLPNRSWLLDHLHEQLGDPSGDPGLIVAFLDLDGFKSVNDRLGHAAGDDVLAAVADGLARCLGPGEAVARVGGDEFVVVSPAVDGAAVADLVDRMRDAVSKAAAAVGQSIGVSIGTTASTPGDQPWDLLGRADAAMYGDKRRRDDQS